MYIIISVFYLYGKTTFKFYRKQDTNKKRPMWHIKINATWGNY